MIIRLTSWRSRRFAIALGRKGKEGRKEGLGPVSRGLKPLETPVRPAGEDTARRSAPDSR